MARKKRITPEDAKILRLVYDCVDWQTRVWYTNDFLRNIPVRYEKSTLLYHLRKLTDMGFLQALNGYPKSWTAINNHEVRKKVEDLIVKLEVLIRR